MATSTRSPHWEAPHTETPLPRGLAIKLVLFAIAFVAAGIAVLLRTF